MVEVSFGEWLQRQRKAAGLTQQQLAEQMSCSTITLRKIEAEERKPSAQIIERLAEIFKITSNEQIAFLRFARGDWRSAPTLEREDAPWRASSASLRSNLPIPLTGFIGREKEVEEIVRLLSKNRLVTLTGPGGVGKTRLAIESASKLTNKFKDGIRWIDLVGLNDHSLVTQTVAQVMDVYEVPNRPLIEIIAEQLQSKEIVLVLDNCEHLIVACAQLVDRLLGMCKSLKILATSREAFDILGEIIWPVPSLSLPEFQEPFAVKTVSKFEGIRLFADRAMSVQPRFELIDQNANAVVDICRRLSGMPLAIELAAARVKMMSVDEIAKRLDDRFELLTAGSRMALPRHQTLRATIDWSYDLLSEPEQILFCRLSVFAGGFTLDAAEAVCSQGMKQSDIVGLLGRLVDKSLVIVEQACDTRETRYHLLETIRQYSLEKLVGIGEAAVLRDQHLEFYTNLAEQSEPNLISREAGIWLNRLEMELDNIRAAMEWSTNSGKAVAALRMTGSLVYFWLAHGQLLSEWQDRIQQAFSRPDGMERTLARAKALNAIGFLYWADVNLSDRRSELEEALSIGRELGDQWNIATALRSLGLGAIMQGNYVEARSFLEQSLEIWRMISPEDKMGSNLTLTYLGDVALNQGEVDQAQSLYEESLAILKGLGEKNFLAYTVRRLGLLASREGDYEKAMTLCKESLILNQEIGDLRGVFACLAGFADIAIAQGKHERATKLIAAAETQLAMIGIQLLYVDKVEYERILALLRAKVNEKALAKFWAKGKAMTMEEAVAYALE